MTRINPDDPKWTAYILGELNDTERADVELELQSSEEARMLVEELRFAADFAKTELRESVAVTPLTRQGREKIYASAAASSNVLRPRVWLGVRPAVWATGLAAASIALIASMVALSPMLLRSPSGASAPASVQIAEAQKTEAPALAAPPAAPDPGKPASESGLRYEQPTNVPAAPEIGLSRTPERQVNEAPPVEAKKEAAATGADASNVQAEKDARLQVEAVTVPRDKAVIVPTDNLRDRPAPSAAPGMGVGGALSGVLGGVLRDSGRGGGGGGRGGAAGAATGQQGQQGQGGQQDQQGQQSAEYARASAGAARSPIYQQEAAPPPPPPPPARFRLPPAPGVPPAFDRTAPNLFNGAESYAGITDNPFVAVRQNPLSTFSIDVDTASYSNVRRYLNQNQMPPRDAVRIEEMINYFTYDYPQPAGNNPIGATIEAASAPWNPQHRLVRVGIKAKDIGVQRRPPSNLVFLLDVSGSMQPAERLPLLKDGIRMVVQQLTANDRVTVVTYAGTTGVALQPTRGDQKDIILRLVDSLQAGGSTNGGSGIQLAYEQAMANFIPGGVNRIILATDGDFNVGITDRTALLRLIEDRAKTGVFLTVLGVGMGNFKDATLEMLADKGHGNYAYLDTLNEARKVLVDQMSSTFITVAKDVKVQVEFNPAMVDAYRLIGYENRALRNEDFNNDLKDAGDMGAGHTVTALYEVVPRGVAINAPGVDPLKYSQPPAPSPAANASNETLTVKIRYKEPVASDSKLLVFPLVDREQTFARSAADFRFAAAVASFGMILRDSPYKGTATMDSVLSIAEDSMGSDRNRYRSEFMQLVQRARQIRGR